MDEKIGILWDLSELTQVPDNHPQLVDALMAMKNSGFSILQLKKMISKYFSKPDNRPRTKELGMRLKKWLDDNMPPWNAEQSGYQAPPQQNYQAPPQQDYQAPPPPQSQPFMSSHLRDFMDVANQYSDKPASIPSNKSELNKIFRTVSVTAHPDKVRGEDKENASQLYKKFSNARDNLMQLDQYKGRRRSRRINKKRISRSRSRK